MRKTPITGKPRSDPRAKVRRRRMQESSGQTKQGRGKVAMPSYRASAKKQGLPPKEIRYAPNQVGVDFPVELKTHDDKSGHKEYEVSLFILDQPSRVDYFVARISKLDFARSKSVPGSIEAISGWATGSSSKLLTLDATISFRENACIVDAGIFITRLEFDLEIDAIKSVAYTPTGNIERRESDEGLGRSKQQQRKGRLPFPDISHRAEANRNSVKLGVRVSRDLVEQMKAAAAAEGIPQTEWLERLLKSALEP